MPPGTDDGVKYCCGGLDPDDIVITGMAGRFPESENVKELCEALYSGKELIIPADRRWPKGVLGLKDTFAGQLKDLSKFDADFFGMVAMHANDSDPLQRLLLQVSYEAILDSGYDPQSLRGRTIGVYSSVSEMEAKEIRLKQTKKSKNIAGYLRCMNANRCSYYFDFHGPSVCLDTACSSSAFALKFALDDIREGRCEAALVTGAQLLLMPEMTEFYSSSGVAAGCGLSSPFDANSDGIIRSETVAALFIQKTSQARRVYATIANMNTHTAGFVNEGISVPSRESQEYLFEKTLREIGVKHSDIEYIEAHGTGTQVGDPIELNSIANVFCKNRTKPLLVGTVKSNIGHTEPAAGICGIIKSILAFETGMVAPNMHYAVPNPGCPALVRGDMKVITTPTPITCKYIPVNSFGIGGANAHLILKKNPIEYSKKSSSPKIPRIVLYPATTEEGVQSLFKHLDSTPLRDEFYSLLNNLSFASTMYKPYRGYMIKNTSGKTFSEVKHSSQRNLKVWYVMTGMGCQWPGMGLSLMKIDIFAESMKKSAKVIKPFGIDLFELLDAGKKHLQQHRSITPAFVAITAIQIALIDLLSALGIRPDGIVGHSTGELACAYADGCFSAEQTLLSAYWRGKAVESANLPIGAMAAVGLTWEEAVKRCPENVFPACHNADDSITISGLKEPLEKFVDELKAENVFARVVNAYGFAFHCSLIWPAANTLRTVLRKIITHPKPRTERWLSSSYLESEWDKPECKAASSEYFVHNLMSNVRFNEVLKKIPSDAVTIEIGPHFLLQSILKRAIGSNATYLGLMKRDQDNVEFLLHSIGKLYTIGLDPQIEKLYPAARYPVPRTTPFISDLMKWDHSVSWDVVKWETHNTGSVRMTIDPTAADSYLLDHCIEGRSLFPAMGYIYLAWEAFSIRQNKRMMDMAITVENFKILHAVILSHTEQKPFFVAFLNATGDFEIVESNSLVASGRITYSMKKILPKFPLQTETNEATVVSGGDIYNELKIYGYEYGPHFQGLLEMDVNGQSGLVSWNDRWIPYLDSLLLFFGMIDNCHTFPLPTGALSIKVDPSVLTEVLAERESKGLVGLPVSYNPNTKRCLCAGVEIIKLKAEPASHRASSENTPTLEQYAFVPYINPYVMSEEEERKCIEYIYACDEVVKRITTSLGDKRWNHMEFTSVMIQDVDLESYIGNISEEHSLLKALNTILALSTEDQTVQRRKEIFKAYIKTIKNDIMYNTLVSEKTLRIALDIIAENSSRKLSLLEVTKELAPLSPEICKLMRRYNHREFSKCVVMSSDTSSLDVSAHAEFNIEVKDIENLSKLDPDQKKDVSIGSFLNGDYNYFHLFIKTLISATKPSGFILLFCKSQMMPAETFLYTLSSVEVPIFSEEEQERIIRQEELLIVSKFSDCFGSSMYLLRNPSTLSPLTSKVLSVDGGFGKWVDEVKNSMSDDNLDKIWLVSEKDDTNGVIGLVNCLRQEPGGEKIRCVFAASKSTNEKLPAFSVKEPFFANCLKKDLLVNVYKDSEWGSFRHLSINDEKKLQIVDQCNLHCTRYGDLSSFQWLESSIPFKKTETNRSLFSVYYASINFKDVMIATGKLSFGVSSSSGEGDCVLGMEYSGKDSTGRRVMGFVFKTALATNLCPHPFLTFDVPDHWTLEEASTIPVIYTTCYFALFMRGKMIEGESILIHSGTGGIGQAAIRISLSMGCEIFTTVGNEAKKKHLMELFPQLKDENIGCSRNTSFEDMIMERTKGKGVDMVLNSLADDKFYASVRCLKKHGRFLEIGKYDLMKDSPIGLGAFVDDITFHVVCLDAYYSEKRDDYEVVYEELRRYILEGIKSGVVKPLNRTVFHRDEVEKAFRYMAGGTHTGKVIVKIRDEEPNKHAVPQPLKLPAIPITFFYSQKVYIIVGGLGGFGIELAKWLAKKGAHNIVLTSRYGVRTPYHRLCMKRWKEQGLNIVVSTLNVAKKEEANKLIQEVSIVGPIGGIFNSALVLQDAFMENQTTQYFEEVCAPKAMATKHLDELSRRLCPSLDYFVCFSSISCGKGNAGQSNYGYANSVMERICEKRVSDGLHGLSVQWGIIGDVGIVHRQVGDDARIAGVRAQGVKSCLDTLDSLCRLKMPVVSSHVNADTMKTKEGQGSVLTQIAKIFGMESDSNFNVHRSLSEMGMDSMIGVEVKHLLESYCDTTFSIQELSEMKIEDVKNLVEKADAMKEDKPAVATAVTATHINFPQSFVPEAAITKITTKIGIPIFIVCLSDHEQSHITALAESLMNTTFIIQWAKDMQLSDVPNMAKWCLQEVQKYVGSSPIHLIGYKLGSALALEMAAQNQAQVRYFCLLDSYTNFIKYLDEQESARGNEISHLMEFVSQFIPNGIPNLDSELLHKETLEQKVTAVVNALAGSSTQTVDKKDLSEATYGYIKRRNILDSYAPNTRIANDITIIESSSELLANEVSVVKSLTSKICSGKIAIHRVATPSNLLSDAESISKVITVLEIIL